MVESTRHITISKSRRKSSFSAEIRRYIERYGDRDIIESSEAPDIHSCYRYNQYINN